MQVKIASFLAIVFTINFKGVLLLNLTNQQLIYETQKLASLERKTLKQILDHLQEIYDRRLYVDMGYSNFIKFLIKEFKYSESAAYRRYNALKLTKEIPEAKEMIASGELNLTNITMIQNELKGQRPEVKAKAITAVKGKTSRETEKDLRAMTGRSTGKRTIRVELSDETLDKLDQLKALTKEYDLDKVLNIALTTAIEQATVPVKQRGSLKSKRPRQIAKSLRSKLMRKVHHKCQHPDCNERHFLEIDHILSVVKGGTNEEQNLRVLCRSHNQQAAFKQLGDQVRFAF